MKHLQFPFMFKSIMDETNNFVGAKELGEMYRMLFLLLCNCFQSMMGIQKVGLFDLRGWISWGGHRSTVWL